MSIKGWADAGGNGVNGDTLGRGGVETRVGGWGAALGLAFLAAGIEGVDIKLERFFKGRVNARVGSLAGLLCLLEGPI